MVVSYKILDFSDFTGKSIVYFEASSEYVDSWRLAYNSTLSFTFGFLEMEDGSPEDIFVGDDILLICRSSGTSSLSISGVIDQKVVMSTYSVPFFEKAGWVKTRTREAPTRIEFLDCLKKLSKLQLRASFHKYKIAFYCTDSS
jgi:hypothetical protein